MYHSILVCQDTSEQSHKALELAIWMADCTRARLTLIHLHARKPLGVGAPSQEEVLALLEERRLHCEASKLPCSVKVVEGWTAQGLLKQTHWHDLVVLGKRGASHASHGRKLGSLTSALLGSSPVPVLVVDEAPKAPETLLVVFDESPDACKALRMAVDLAMERELNLHVVEPVAKAGQADKLSEAAQYLAQCPGIHADLQRLEGKAGETVVAYVRREDVHLTFLPALDRSLFGTKLVEVLAEETASSLWVPEGRVREVY